MKLVKSVYLYFREFKDSEIEDEIREAFKVFDKEGNGFVKTAGMSLEAHIYDDNK